MGRWERKSRRARKRRRNASTMKVQMVQAGAVNESVPLELAATTMCSTSPKSRSIQD